mmetsp:Transcript_4435/g.5356  ORF Transcript_4435/g.5356 Transcript_4435/m.5356 type:complete len:98 (+) Transcript_4435:14-307(+)
MEEKAAVKFRGVNWRMEEDAAMKNQGGKNMLMPGKSTDERRRKLSVHSGGGGPDETFALTGVAEMPDANKMAKANQSMYAIGSNQKPIQTLYKYSEY